MCPPTTRYCSPPTLITILPAGVTHPEEDPELVDGSAPPAAQAVDAGLDALFAQFAQAPLPVETTVLNEEMPPWQSIGSLSNTRKSIRTFSTLTYDLSTGTWARDSLGDLQPKLAHAKDIASLPPLLPFVEKLKIEPLCWPTLDLDWTDVKPFKLEEEPFMRIYTCRDMSMTYRGRDPSVLVCPNTEPLYGKVTWSGPFAYGLRFHCDWMGEDGKARCPDGNYCFKDELAHDKHKAWKQTHMMGSDFIVARRAAEAVEYILRQDTATDTRMSDASITAVLGHSLHERMGFTFRRQVMVELANERHLEQERLAKKRKADDERARNARARRQMSGQSQARSSSPAVVGEATPAQRGTPASTAHVPPGSG